MVEITPYSNEPDWTEEDMRLNKGDLGEDYEDSDSWGKIFWVFGHLNGFVTGWKHRLVPLR